ncbi:MAG: DUF1810 domain-containing protein [Tannerella sp.]|jgi:uncharacterized protein (DUF1810 family)|nr:DUF1810 domain-containing protein [Tannerella sp.]
MKLFSKLNKSKRNDSSADEKNSTQSENPTSETQKSGEEKTVKSVVHNLIILDESGSMASIAGSTVSGLKELTHTIRQGQIDFPSQQHFVTIYSFEGGKINKRLAFKKVDGIDMEQFIHFSPGGMTNLYDAVGTGINDMERHIGKENMFTDVLVTILTDGEENASREFSYRQIQGMIADRMAKGWIFSYIGTDHDVNKVSTDLGIQNVQIFSKNDEDMQRMWEQEKKARLMHHQSKMNYDMISADMDDATHLREKREWSSLRNRNFYRQKDIYRFKRPHMQYFETALQEIRNGRKESHWMWYIFPQLEGLGHSQESQDYGLQDLDEAREYIENQMFGRDLIHICGELLKLPTNDAEEIFGQTDALKLRSSMTLFSLLNVDPVFQAVLDKYFEGKKDRKTLNLLGINA